MDNARFMGFCEPIRGLRRNGDGLLQGNWASSEHVAQQLSLDKLHCDVVSSIDLPQLEDRDDVWVIDSRGRTGFPLKAFKVLFTGRQLARKDLDGQVTAEASVPRPINLAHTASSEWRENFIATESCAGGKCQRFVLSCHDRARRCEPLVHIIIITHFACGCQMPHNSDWRRIANFWRVFMDVRSLQRPLKEQYRREPSASRITLTARGAETATPMTCSVDIGRAIYQAEAHKGVGGTGTAACSGDLLLGALAACAQITCQLVAVAMGVPTQHIEVTVSGDLDLQGTLGLSKNVRVGFEAIRVKFDIDAPQAAPEQLRALQEKTEQYCVVLQTMLRSPRINTEWSRS